MRTLPSVVHTASCCSFFRLSKNIYTKNRQVQIYVFPSDSHYNSYLPFYLHHRILFNHLSALINRPAFLPTRQCNTTIPAARFLSCRLCPFECFFGILEVIGDHGGKVRNRRARFCQFAGMKGYMSLCLLLIVLYLDMIVETQELSVQQRYEQWNDDLYNRYIMEYPETSHDTIWDGVISPVDYAKTRIKVMFLNREAYDNEKGNSFDLSKDIRNRIEKDEWVFPYQHTLRTHLKQYLTVIDLGQNGFLELSDDEVRKYVKATDYYEFIRLLKCVAYCNIKKSDGQPRSNLNNLKECAKRNIGFIKEQIAFFNPSIILGGDICEGVLNDIPEVEWGNDLYIGPDRHICIWQIKVGDSLYPLVDMFHPSRTQGMREYYLEFLHAMQAVERSHTNFWFNSYDKPCFVMPIT